MAYNYPVFTPDASPTASRAAVTDANGKLTTSATTATELGYVSGVTSGIQTQLNTKPTVLTATASLDFPNILASASADLTITVTGAAVGDAVVLGPPADPDAGLTFLAFVSAADTVTVRACNFSSGAIDQAAKTFRVTVLDM
jgi:hypothetical protein